MKREDESKQCCRRPVQPAAQKSTKLGVGFGNIRCSSSFDHTAELLCLPPCVPVIEGPRKPTPALKTPAPTRGLTFNFYQRYLN
ncbi:hypothetical protein C1H46_009732 [Malus baccata]|uniref:Uncharacterized protein n=1 Tax=Malus baccata TaxID=106549 RepID=A0A540N0X3_MALBA|nr:hypothetical protein C1H46_009732 [Malus baccata]